MIGLSSTYYGFQKIPVYESAKKVFDLGFDTVELGAGHYFEPNIWSAIKRIKCDFPDKNYTVHGLFPPLKERFWFNASLGLTSKNIEVIEGLFKTAQLTGAKVVSLHPGFATDVGWPEDTDAMTEPVSLKKIPAKKAWQNLFTVVEKCLFLAGKTGCSFAIENLTVEGRGLVFSIEDFERVFQKFPKLGLLLDFGHGLYTGMLPKLLESFSERIAEIHLHFSRQREQTEKVDEHRSITSLKQIEPLCTVRQLDKIPIIFEHGTNISETDIKLEKKILEEFLK